MYIVSIIEELSTVCQGGRCKYMIVRQNLFTFCHTVWLLPVIKVCAVARVRETLISIYTLEVRLWLMTLHKSRM